MKLETDSYQASIMNPCECRLAQTDFYECRAHLDNDRSLLGFQNGVYDLTTNGLQIDRQLQVQESEAYLVTHERY